MKKFFNKLLHMIVLEQRNRLLNKLTMSNILNRKIVYENF